MSAPATPTALVETPACARPPGRAAVGTCERCGAFYREAEPIRHGEHTEGPGGVLALLVPAMGLTLWLHASTRVRLLGAQLRGHNNEAASYELAFWKATRAGESASSFA